MIIYGINPVLEALRAGRVKELRIVDRTGGRIADVLKIAEASAVPIRRVSQGELDRAARGGVHQGVAADLAEAESFSVGELLSGLSTPPLLVVLDGIEDPHNVGAILRTVDAAGAHGVIRQSRHAAPLSGAAAKASAGAVSHVKVADVVNIARAIEELKAAGVWTVGLAGGVERTYDQIDMTLPTALVLGAEGSGLRRLVRERCDWVVSIPLFGHVDSLNVSVAAGIALFEAVRQRRQRSFGASR
ncbi:MAG TPA: 23S rRNA (guanosine(2251)-2'-O)-methyltransferase RlmB [Vicinamibacterales bacterium]|nr:23S rRNA (guanosine(2251)-2'-O)-methyltransferase RlmB [Vicinamibacterales bacterium]